METKEIRKFLNEGLLSGKILRRATDLQPPALSNRLKRGTPFKDNELTYLKVLYWPLFKKLYPEYLNNSVYESLAEAPEEMTCP